MVKVRFNNYRFLLRSDDGVARVPAEPRGDLLVSYGRLTGVRQMNAPPITRGAEAGAFPLGRISALEVGQGCRGFVTVSVHRLLVFDLSTVRLRPRVPSHSRRR